jgi:hypothetical protein
MGAFIKSSTTKRATYKINYDLPWNTDRYEWSQNDHHQVNIDRVKVIILGVDS